MPLIGFWKEVCITRELTSNLAFNPRRNIKMHHRSPESYNISLDTSFKLKEKDKEKEFIASLKPTYWDKCRFKSSNIRFLDCFPRWPFEKPTDKLWKQISINSPDEATLPNIQEWWDVHLEDCLRPTAYEGLATSSHPHVAYLHDILQSITIVGRSYLAKLTQGSSTKDSKYVWRHHDDIYFTYPYDWVLGFPKWCNVKRKKKCFEACDRLFWNLGGLLSLH